MSNVNSNLKTEMAVVSSLILDESKNGKKIHLVTVDERRDSSAFTDGSSVIQVPVNFGNVTPQLRSVAYGFLSHEASHCRNSNFTIIRELKEKYGGLAQRLLNAIEDPRIERIAIKQFPGQRDHLITTKEHVIAQGWWTGPDPQGICWQEALHSFSLFWGNVCVGFKCAEPLMKSWEKIFNDVFTHYCGKSAPDFIREQIKTAVLSDQADAPALAVEKILDLILANKDKFRKDLQNLPEESRTTSSSYDLKGLYDEEQEQQQQQNTGNGTGSNGSNADGESTGEGSGSDSEDAEGSNADSAGSESADESNGTESEDAEGSNADSDGSESSEGSDSSETEGDNADSNGTDGEDGAESEAEGSDTDGETDSAGSETGDAEEETEGSNADGEADAEGNSEDADGDNAGSVGSETGADEADDEADGNGSNTEAGADEADSDGEGSESEGDSTDSEDAGSDGEASGASGCTPTFGGVPLDQSKAQQEAEEDAMQKAFKELQADAANAQADNPLPVVTTTCCYNDQMTERSFMADNLSDIRNLGLKLKKEFSKKLQDKVLSAKGLKSSGRRFSGSHMAGIATGNYKIFESKDFVKKPSASVEVLLDISGSMHKDTGHGRVIEIAQKAVGALMFGLDIQGIETEFSVFPGVHKQNWTGYCVVKRFDDRNTALMLKSTYLCANGATPDAYGVMGATINLSKRKNANKICLVLTDGDICSQTIDIMARGKENGIKYYGIAINTQLPPFIFEKYVEVLDPTTLPDVLLKLAREVIQI